MKGEVERSQMWGSRDLGVLSLKITTCNPSGLYGIVLYVITYIIYINWFFPHTGINIEHYIGNI
jgi:hypothetical protein